MKKEIIGVSAVALVLLAAIFIPVNTVQNYENQTYKINAHLIINEQNDFNKIDTLLRYNIREFLIIKRIHFPPYESENMSIELIQNNSDKIANFTYFYEVDYYLTNESDLHSKQINLTGIIIFRDGRIENPETHLDFEI